MNPRKLSRRQKLNIRWLAITLVVISGVAALILALRDAPEKYEAGERIDAITRSLSRDMPEDAPLISFREVSEEAGILFRHFPGRRSTQLPEDMGSGAAWGDYDGDGDPDLFVCNIAGPLTMTPEERENSEGSNRLYRNLGAGHFEDATAEAGLEYRGTSMGAAWADWDNDGDLDLTVTTYGPLLLYENQGNGRFRETAAERGLGNREGFYAGASWGDYDRDGDLDLYVCGYVRYEFSDELAEQSTFQYKAAVPFTLNPSSYEPEENLLFRNLGGRFEEVAAEAGVQNMNGRSLSAAWSDLNGDGWPDLYVANDISDNVLYQNRGDGTFEDVSHQAWVADYRGAMGLALGDWDNDLDIDMFVTHWIAQENALYDNTLRFAGESSKEPKLAFFDIADQTGLGQIALEYIGWGTSFLDYDNDGRQDLLVVNGSTFQEEEDKTRLKAMRSCLFWNKGPEEGFFEVGVTAGEFFARPSVGRGLALADFDDDGDLDAFIVRFGEKGVLLENQASKSSNWLKVRVRGNAHNLQGLGARVEAFSDGWNQVQIIGAQASYLSQNFAEAHFGLGSRKRIDRLTVVFPCGQKRELRDIEANQKLLIREEPG